MTLEERLAGITDRANKDREAEAQKKNAEDIRYEATTQAVKDLTNRIRKLIVLVNKCINEGIKLPGPSEMRKYGYGSNYGNYDFFADGIYHHVGFMDARRGCWRQGESQYNEVIYLGIEMGGAYGKWDFYTNGNVTFDQHEDTKERRDAEQSHLDKFLKEFPIFEKAFYCWLDSYIKGV